MRQIAATRRGDGMLQQIASCDMWKSLSLHQNFVAVICRRHSKWFEFVRQIAATKLAQATLRQRVYPSATSHCDNLNQPMREHQLESHHVKFELVYISSLPKSIACTEQMSYRSDLLQHQCRRRDLLPWRVAAICRIVCLCLNNSSLIRFDSKKSMWFFIILS